MSNKNFFTEKRKRVLYALLKPQPTSFQRTCIYYTFFESNISFQKNKQNMDYIKTSTLPVVEQKSKVDNTVDHPVDHPPTPFNIGNKLIVPYHINKQGEIKRPEHLIAWWKHRIFLYLGANEFLSLEIRTLCRLFRDSLNPLPTYIVFPHPKFTSLTHLCMHFQQWKDCTTKSELEIGTRVNARYKSLWKNGKYIWSKIENKRAARV